VRRLHGEENLDTAPFRLGIWYLVLYDRGMVHDDYDYGGWSTLNSRVSNYTRLVACRPEEVTFQARGHPHRHRNKRRAGTHHTHMHMHRRRPRRMCCSDPWVCGRRPSQDFDNLGVDLYEREKVHINLLIMEARRQAELVYATQAVVRLTEE
jgi:hypothetical protein